MHEVPTFIDAHYLRLGEMDFHCDLYVGKAPSLPCPVEGPTFHDLRPTTATGLVSAGVDVKTAQCRLGPSQVRLTLELYAEAVTEEDRKASDTLAERLMPRQLDRGA